MVIALVVVFYLIALELVYQLGKRTAKLNLERGWHEHAAWCWSKSSLTKSSIDCLAEVPFEYTPYERENP